MRHREITMKYPSYWRAAAMTLAVLLPAGAYAAERQDLRHASDVLTNVRSNKAQSAQKAQPGETAPALQEAMGLPESDGLNFIKSRVDHNTGKRHSRFRQTHRGVPLWSDQVVVTENADGTVELLHGNVVKGIGNDVASVDPGLSAEQAILKAKQLERQQDRAKGRVVSEFRDESAELVIWLDAEERAHLAYAITYYSDINGGGAPSRPTYILDARNGRLLDNFDQLAHVESGTGPGGNGKTGQYRYGTQFGKLDVAVSGNTCTMNNVNVKTVDLNHGTSGSTAYSFPCFENTRKIINGAFSPLNDAHFFGGVVFNMYRQWYNTAPLSFQLVMRVHYSSNYANAFWDGRQMTFGDGGSSTYPFVALDVAAHEVSHGVTTQNSNLVYSGQSGGINEAFSDMAGETAELFMRGSNDFKVGFDIIKSSGALRYMNNPPQDGRSIDNAANFRTGMDVHHSSGVFNKAFYLLSTTSGWGVRKAFQVFLVANQNFWTPNATFTQAAIGVRDAAASLGYNTGDVVAAFSAVGVTISGGTPTSTPRPTATPTVRPTPTPTTRPTPTPTVGPTATPRPTATPTPTPSGSFPAWQEGQTYTVGTRVSYQARNYECLQTHTACVGCGWNPAVTPSLWKAL
jgi:vibriolysin